MKNKRNKGRGAFFAVLLSFFFMLAVIIRSACSWFDIRFGVGFEEILFTIASPMSGSNADFLAEAVKYVIRDLAVAAGILLLCIFIGVVLKRVYIKLHITLGKRNFSLDLYKLHRLVCILTVAVIFSESAFYCVRTLKIDDYIIHKLDKTTIYEDYYIKPEEVAVSSSGTPRNLIFIYMESMENSYASKELGGEPGG